MQRLPVLLGLYLLGSLAVLLFVVNSFFLLAEQQSAVLSASLSLPSSQVVHSPDLQLSKPLPAHSSYHSGAYFQPLSFSPCQSFLYYYRALFTAPDGPTSLLPAPLLLSPYRMLALFLSYRGNLVLLLNCQCCLLLAVVIAAHQLVFEKFYGQEIRILQDSLFNFFTFRVMFIAVLVDFVDVRQVLLWSSFFLLIAHWRCLIAWSLERYAILTTLPLPASTLPVQKYLALLVSIIALNAGVLLALIALVWRLDIHLATLMMFEPAVVILNGVKALLKYRIHYQCLEAALQGVANGAGDERGGENGDRAAAAAAVLALELHDATNTKQYYIDLVFDIVNSALSLCHLLHVWWHYGFSLTLIDLFLFLNARASLLNIYQRVQGFREYRRARHVIQHTFPDATQQELIDNNDVCAVCRDSMIPASSSVTPTLSPSGVSASFSAAVPPTRGGGGIAKKLPCNHIFHSACLNAWIEHNAICPSCRAPISGQPRREGAERVEPDARGARANVLPARAVAANLPPVEAHPVVVGDAAPAQGPELGDVAAQIAGDEALARALAEQDQPWLELGDGLQIPRGDINARQANHLQQQAGHAQQSPGESGAGIQSIFRFDSGRYLGWLPLPLPAFSIQVIRSTHNDHNITRTHPEQSTTTPTSVTLGPASAAPDFSECKHSPSTIEGGPLLEEFKESPFSFSPPQPLPHDTPSAVESPDSQSSFPVVDDDRVATPDPVDSDSDEDNAITIRPRRAPAPQAN